ncbi:MAG TPA: hypothetical protein VF077_03845 [Nitrospiraceae bacterium]
MGERRVSRKKYVPPIEKTAYPPMTRREYEDALIHFDMPNTRFADAIGVGWRQGQRYRDGESAIPESVAKLIRLLIRRRISPERLHD